ncbi:plastocyanin/azurin family copper-binding protein [Haloferax sp. DFSO60]|uniref:cupredoxin domain-containing protein n=1 Tax=Haloferax sp. DFSO60 TaxID=3388652 RepID=UPI00397CDA65
MTDNSLSRRRILQLTGGATIVGLAGCVGVPTNTQRTPPQTGVHTPADHHDEGGMTTHHDDQMGHGHRGGDDDGATDSDDDHTEPIGPPTDRAEVAMRTTSAGFHFEPHVVRVNTGGTVTFVNESGTHSTTAYHPDNGQPQLVPDGAASWDSGILTERAATFEHTFDVEGVYHYYCIPHEALEMIATVIVGYPDPDEQVALREIPADKSEPIKRKLAELNEMTRKALAEDDQ